MDFGDRLCSIATPPQCSYECLYYFLCDKVLTILFKLPMLGLKGGTTCRLPAGSDYGSSMSGAVGGAEAVVENITALTTA